MTETEFKHWRLEYDLDKVCWLTLDRQGERINSLSREVLEELDEIVGRLESSPPEGLVLQSGKPGQFIVGADIREFDDVNDPEQATEWIHSVHLLMGRIESLPFPTVVTIEGYCLGGGLELALAFDYRIAKDVEQTRLGFPETRLGIFPGFGGSARSVQQCGPLTALPLILTARNLHAKAARGAHLVDELVGPHGELRWAARRAIAQRRKSRGSGLTATLQNIAPVRRILAGQMRKKTAAKANPDHYPAPFDLIDAWEACGDDPHAMMAQEAIRVGRLITTPTSRNLRRVFKLSERLKRYGKVSGFKARRVHVVGAGTMGGDIAAWCVVQGLEVTLQDREYKYIEPALARAKQLFNKILKTPERVLGAMSRLIPDVDGIGVAHADVVIEAIYENPEAKQKLFAELEKKVRPDTVLATNTSAIPLATISEPMDKPERLIGLHFFNPVSKMPLVEVVYGPDTDSDHVGRGTSFCNQINRFPLPVKSSPGFLVNRVLSPYLLKAFRMHLQDGIPGEALDRAATRFGMPMGPVELADVVGLDIGLEVIRMLGGKKASREREQLKEMVDAGHLGKKSGEGFYRWEKGKPRKDEAKVSGHDLDQLAQQLLQPYFDECRTCLGEQIVEDADVLDAGMIFGTGFAPFRGGPLHYLRSLQAADAAGSQDEPGPAVTTDTPEPAPKARPARKKSTGKRKTASRKKGTDK